MFFFCRFVDKVGCPSLYNEYVEKIWRETSLSLNRGTTLFQHCLHFCVSEHLISVKSCAKKIDGIFNSSIYSVVAMAASLSSTHFLGNVVHCSGLSTIIFHGNWNIVHCCGMAPLGDY